MKVLVAETQKSVPIGALGPPLREHDFDLIVWRAGEEPRPRSLAGFDALIALGGSANPDEDRRFPWLAEERELLREALERRLPTLGLCLGAELLAEVLGGTPRRLPKSRIGWFSISASDAAARDPLYAVLPARQHVFEWHGYGFALPAKACLLAGDGDSVQAFS